ncbi:uncharacterized protein LOC106445392 isoform X4 [Brassica napus]|uniref:uncharacterized protein LOC106313663 isoform X2 n=1 Tax=Brassica oleracea var. oleracea TaxID=109376 RepID=UPI0006A74144|nr:PREDICTED: uncharacterized protein LOC106313663 isoform X2 [Brassica oleracea var. oleracea]XP_048625873.1 uncharacterized protein LOC106445392 isoform X4 [Brassica napus]
MRRGNHRPKAAAGSLKKKTDGFTNPDPSTSRDLKRRRSVSFVDADHHRSHSPEAQTGPSVDAKTSEFAFFNKLKSTFGLSSSEASNKLKQNPKDFESRGQIHNGTDLRAKDITGNTTTCSFTTPIYNARRGSPLNLTRKDKEKDPGKGSSGFNRDKDTVRGGNNNLSCGGSSDEKEDDFFSVKRKRLNQWVKHTWFPDITPQLLTSNGGNLVSLLLTRLFPGTDEKHPSRFSKERTERRTFLDSPGSKFLKRSHESYSEVDHGLQIEKKRAISWPENSIATNHVHYSCIPRDPQDFNFPFSYPKEPVYRPPLLTQKTFISFPVEETLDSSLHFRNYNSPSLGYHGEDIGYSSEALLPHDYREPSSALLLEWNTENASTRKTDDLQPSNHTELITCPNASSSLADNPWRSDYSSSHDVVTRELYPLPLLSHYTSGSFLLPATNQTRHFEHELERHMIDDEDVVAANQNLQTFHQATSLSDCLTRGHTYYHSPSNSPLDHSPFKSPGREMVSFPFSSISNSDLLEESSPTTQSDRWWI